MANLLDSNEYNLLLANLESTKGLPAGALRAMAKQESNGNTNAVSPKGAKGVFQFMPATAKQYGVDVTDPISSAKGAANFMSDLMKQYEGNFDAALAHYNGGNSQAASVIKVGAPTYPETQNYVQRIKTGMNQKTQPAASTDISDEEFEARLAAKKGNPAPAASNDISDEEFEARLAAKKGKSATEKSAIDYLTTSAKNLGEGVNALARGVQKGATLGFNDEITGAFQSAIDWARGKTVSPTDTYVQHRDAARASDKAAFEKNPLTGLSGEVAGGMIPAVATGGGSTLPELVGQGTAYGMMQGAGISEADTAAGVAQDATTGGMIGGAAGVAIPAVARVGKVIYDSPVAKATAKSVWPSIKEGASAAGEEALSWVGGNQNGLLRNLFSGGSKNPATVSDLKPVISGYVASTAGVPAASVAPAVMGTLKGVGKTYKGIKSAYDNASANAAYSGDKPVWMTLLDDIKTAARATGDEIVDEAQIARKMFTDQQTTREAKKEAANKIGAARNEAKWETKRDVTTGLTPEEIDAVELAEENRWLSKEFKRAAEDADPRSHTDEEDLIFSKAEQEADRAATIRNESRMTAQERVAATQKAEEDRLAAIRAKGAERDAKAAAESANKTNEPVTGPFAKILSAIEQKKSGSVTKSADDVIAEGEARREAERAERLARIRGEDATSDEGTDLLSWANEGRAKAAADKAELDAAVKEMKAQPNPDANIDQVISMKKANVAKRLANAKNPAERAALQKSLDALDEGINADIITTGTIDNAAQQRASDIMNAPMLIEELEQTLKTTTDPKVYKDTQKEIRRLERLVQQDNSSTRPNSMGLMTAGIRDKNPLNDPDTVERFGKGIDAARVEAGHLPGEQQRVYDILRSETPTAKKMTIQEKMDSYKNSPEKQAEVAAKIKELGLDDQSYESVMEFLQKPMPQRAAGVKVPESTSPPYDWSLSKEAMDTFETLKMTPEQIKQNARRKALEKLADNPTQVTESAADRAARHAAIVEDVKKYGPGGKEQAEIDQALLKRDLEGIQAEELPIADEVTGSSIGQEAEDAALAAKNAKLKQAQADELPVDDVAAAEAPAMDPQANELIAAEQRRLEKPKVTENGHDVEHIDVTGNTVDDLLFERFGDSIPEQLTKDIANLEVQKTGNKFRDQMLDKKIQWLIQDYKPKGE